MAKQFKQIMGSVSRPDLLLLEYDQAIAEGYVRIRERRAGTRIIIDLERDLGDEILGAKVTEVFVDEAEKIVEEASKENSKETEASKEVETPKQTARKTTAKAK